MVFLTKGWGLEQGGECPWCYPYANFPQDWMTEKVPGRIVSQIHSIEILAVIWNRTSCHDAWRRIMQEGHICSHYKLGFEEGVLDSWRLLFLTHLVFELTHQWDYQLIRLSNTHLYFGIPLMSLEYAKFGVNPRERPNCTLYKTVSWLKLKVYGQGSGLELSEVSSYRPVKLL